MLGGEAGDVAGLHHQRRLHKIVQELRQLRVRRHVVLVLARQLRAALVEQVHLVERQRTAGGMFSSFAGGVGVRLHRRGVPRDRCGVGASR